jgi:hypothetical protein
MSNTIVNLSIDENESQNFFTNLTKEQHAENKEQHDEREIILNEKEIENNNKTNEMLERVNSNQKTIGHNRFQQKIDELEDAIEKNKLYKKEQEMKLNLFKKTISSLQSQLQNHSNIERPSDNNNIKLIEEQSEQINKLTLEISKVKLDNESLNNKLDTELLKISQQNTENTFLVKKYSVLKNEYEILNKNYQNKINEFDKEVYNKLELQNKLNFELSIKENLENELVLLKSQSKTIELEKIILDKDLVIETLNRQLIEMETYTPNYETKKEVKKLINPSIQGRSRGLTNNTRGLKNIRR